ncbi:MAG: ImmA/IrrE family metallo-endopeptidase [Lachnospiraceae bacterium]|nr:ImmA/IrrE family metallo-endopeptidase [Lachnospiraceae bacterium]
MNVEKVKELTDKLEEGLLKLKDSEEFKNYLTCMSKFHSYSYNNTLLIMMQMPQATYVAGYNSWKNNFHRNVKKGEKGIRILAPAPIKKMVETQKTDNEGKSFIEQEEVTIPIFKPVTVFDVSQTEGDPIPELISGELTNEVTGYKELKKALYQVSEIPIIVKVIEGGAKGYFDPNAHSIYINEGMSESQTIKTMIHEIAHSILHDHTKAEVKEEKKDRNVKEVEAESVAFTVCKHFGIDTDDYSFGYILGWSKDATLKEFKQSLETIQRCSSKLIGRIETNLIDLEKEKKSIRQRLSESKEKASRQQTKRKTKEKTHEFSHI